jgi:hypothetical protein
MNGSLLRGIISNFLSHVFLITFLIDLASKLSNYYSERRKNLLDGLESDRNSLWDISSLRSLVIKFIIILELVCY